MIDKIDVQLILDIAQRAGEAILEIYAQDFNVEKKEDNSPLTIADKKSNDIITAGLKNNFQNIPIISEESKQIPFSERKGWTHFWLIDPLDGTKEFIKKNDEFTVNIALIENGNPILGVVYVPVFKTFYYAVNGKGSFKRNASGETIPLKKNPLHYTEKKQVTVVASRSHLTDEVNQFVKGLEAEGKSVQFISAGSSIKICMVAEGTADVYPRFGPTMEWDTAAAHAIAIEAGRKVLQADTRQPLTYNKENLLNPWFIVE